VAPSPGQIALHLLCQHSLRHTTPCLSQPAQLHFRHPTHAMLPLSTRMRPASTAGVQVHPHQAAPLYSRPACMAHAAAVGSQSSSKPTLQLDPSELQPVQCLKEWAVTCAALGAGQQTVSTCQSLALSADQHWTACSHMQSWFVAYPKHSGSCELPQRKPRSACTA
jgi:hypothetical protein